MPIHCEYPHAWMKMLDAEDIRALFARITALEAENKALREGLEPFARYAEQLDRGCVPDTARIAYSPLRLAGQDESVALHFRRARALFAAHFEPVDGVSHD